MSNMSRLNDVADDLAQSAEHVLSSQDRRQLLECFDPVLPRQHKSVSPNNGFHRMGSVANLPGLYAQNDDIDILCLSRIISCQNRQDCEIAVNAFDVKAGCAQRFEVLPARNEHHVITGQRQTPAEVSSDAAAAEYRNSHRFVCLRLWRREELIKYLFQFSDVSILPHHSLLAAGNHARQPAPILGSKEAKNRFAPLRGFPNFVADA